MAPHAALKIESRSTRINNHRSGNWGAAGSLLRVFRVDRFNLLAGNGLKQTLVITVNTMRFSHREDLEQSHPIVRPDTTHTDNLHREVDDTVATDDRLALGWERLNVGRVLVLKALADGIVFTADEHRGDCLETPRPVNNLRQSRDRASQTDTRWQPSVLAK